MPSLTEFRPARPKPGRIARLTIVLDSRTTPARLAQLALICELAGIDAVWVSDRLARASHDESIEAGLATALAGQATKSSFVGGDFQLRERLKMTTLTITRLAANLGNRLEVGIGSPTEDAARGGIPANEELQSFVEAVEASLTSLVPSGAPAGRLLPPLSIELASDGDAELCARWADNAVVIASATNVATLRRWRDALTQACELVGRDPATLGLAIELPVSIGRTDAEARARAEAEPVFHETGSPAEVGIFGTLEECQDRVIELAHAGATEFRCRIPASPDAHDVIAQLTGMVVGRLDVLRPGTARSKAPEPPPWAGPSRQS